VLTNDGDGLIGIVDAARDVHVRSAGELESRSQHWFEQSKSTQTSSPTLENAQLSRRRAPDHRGVEPGNALARRVLGARWRNP
jgi:hypothetical protein